MKTWTIALKNLKRHKWKTAFLIFSLAVGVATVLAVYNIMQTMQLELGDYLDEFGANIVITPRAEGVELNYGDTHMGQVIFEMENLTVTDLERIDDIEERRSINIISPKIIADVDVVGQKALLVSMDTRLEFSMKPWLSLHQETGIIAGETGKDLALLELPPNGVLLGFSAARALGKSAGELLQLNGKAFQVAGVLAETGGEEDGLIFADLGAAQALLGRPGEFSMVEISAYCNFCPIEEIVAQLQEVLPGSQVTALRQSALLRKETMDRYAAFGYILSGIVLLVTGLGIFNTMLSFVRERTREIGILRAIGFRRSHLLQIIFLEALFVSIPGGAAGYTAGILISRLAGPFLAQMQLQVPWRLELALPAMLLAVVLALVSSSVAALKAAALEPAEALRFY
ncbi:MAG: FtsX-like permease family protein [Bacillota bacterium]